MFQLSITAQVITQFVVGAFMIITALRMLDVHPVFRRFVLTPPKAIFKLMRNNARSGSYFSPLILGLATVFLPCGTTQAMEVQAIGSGNAIAGALIMFAFTLGTSPVFFVVGSLATKFSQTMEKYIYPIAAALVLILGIMAIDNGLTLSGSSYTLKEFWRIATQVDTAPVLGTTATTTDSGKSQSATMTVYATGYEPNKLTVKAGIPVNLSLVTNHTQGCSRAITFPTLKIQKILPESGTTELQLPALAKGKVPFSCSMGMFTGVIEVI
jgi:sulfite exporter TauE/SafE